MMKEKLQRYLSEVFSGGFENMNFIPTRYDQIECLGSIKNLDLEFAQIQDT